MFHFISGLPRSGSTLLASILRQNPFFQASIMTPVGKIVTDTLNAMGPGNEADGFVTNVQRANILRGIFADFYMDEIQTKKAIFDNNRRWCANASLLAELWPESKIICCVRAPAAIADSFERLFQKNPLNLSVIYGQQSNLTAYERVMEIMKPTGVMGFALSSFRTAFFGPHKDRLHIIDYDDLCRFPGDVLNDLHQVTEQPPWEYNFKQIEPIPGAAEFDRDISTPGLHDLKSSVVFEQRQSVLPPDIWDSMPPPFWRVKERVTSAP